MEYTIHQAGKSAYVIVGPKDATQFTIVKDTSGAADLVDADIRPHRPSRRSAEVHPLL